MVFAFAVGMLALTASAVNRVVPSPDVVGNAAAVIALTNALLSCVENDTVTLSNGVYDLTGVISEKDNATYGTSHLKTPYCKMTLRGDPAFDREEIVLKGDGTARILRLGKEGSWVKNLTMTNGYATKTGGAIGVYVPNHGGSCYITNCVFRGNESKTDAGIVCGGTLYGCLAESNKSAAEAGALRYGRAYDTIFRDNMGKIGGACYQVDAVRCTFERNRATAEGGAMKYGSSADRCAFLYNESATYGGAVYDGSSMYNCTFIGNVAVNQAGALGNQKGAVTNCWFESNWVKGGASYAAISTDSSKTIKVLDCMFTNNAAGWGNAVSGGVSVWSNCTFVANHMRAESGGNVGTGNGIYYNCTFRGQWSTTSSHQQEPPTNNYAASKRWERMRSVENGRLFDCTIEGCVNNCKMTRCTITCTNTPAVIGGTSVLTNCLVAGCRLERDVNYNPYGIFYGDKGVQLVNCTVADNRGMVFYMVGTNVVNTLFADNVLADGTTSADISVGGSYAAVPVFDHCLYKTKSDTKGVYTNCVVLAAGARVKFNRNTDPTFPYYMPRTDSPAVDKAKDVGFAASDTDRGGYPRVRGTSVDIGCYEAWVAPPGLFLLVL